VRERNLVTAEPRGGHDPRLEPHRDPICYVRPDRVALSAWIQHVPFGMYLVKLLAPESIVELGTRNGVSYSAFCQAVRRLGLSTHCMAVDTWQGDGHTGKYGPGVLADLRRHHDPLYSGFSRLNRARFDEAAALTGNGSVDLLHVDGFHTYEASRHDFDAWLPKMSRRGVVLFHDIAERGRGFGVWRLWDEVTGRYPSFAFHHGHGLGVLGVGHGLPPEMKGIFSMTDREARKFRSFFHRRGEAVGTLVFLAYAARSPVRLGGALVRSVRGLFSNPRQADDGSDTAASLRPEE